MYYLNVELRANTSIFRVNEAEFALTFFLLSVLLNISDHKEMY